MLTKESGFNQSETACCAQIVTFSKDFCHHGDTICHPKSSYVTTKLNGMSTCACNNNAIFSDKAIVTFRTVDVCLPLSIGRGKALAVPAKVARWQHC